MYNSPFKNFTFSNNNTIAFTTYISIKHYSELQTNLTKYNFAELITYDFYVIIVIIVNIKNFNVIFVLVKKAMC